MKCRSPMRRWARATRGLFAGGANYPHCRRHADREISPIEKKWVLASRDPSEPWQHIPFNVPQIVWRYQGELQSDCLERAAQSGGRTDKRYFVADSVTLTAGGGTSQIGHQRCGCCRMSASSSGASRETEPVRLLGDALWRPFQLDEEGAMRIAQVCSEDEYLVGVVVHHVRNTPTSCSGSHLVV